MYKYGTTTSSPLALGLLSGKYNSNYNNPEGYRFQVSLGKVVLIQIKQQYGKVLVSKLTQLEAIAKELGCTQFQLALI